jgi:hypothetical protein
MEKELVDLFEYRKDMLLKQNAKAKPLPKASTEKASTKKALTEKASTNNKPLTSYFKPSTKKGSGLMINLNNI